MSTAEASIRAQQHRATCAHRASFTFAITCISRFMILRHRLMGRTRAAGRAITGNERASRHAIPCAASLLDAMFVEPSSRPAAAAVLLCHGIGETVEHWFRVQQLLAAHGVTSLAFDYSGYGRSTGRPDWDQFELDAMAAFSVLERLAPQLQRSVLGFSLGSGVASATINKIGAHRLVLCQAFTSFRNAALAARVPRPLTRLVPPIWHAQQPLAACRLPVLVVHGAKDWLFPVAMAHELAAYCSPCAQIAIIPGTGHNQPFSRPQIDYWGPIIEWISK